MTGRGVLAEKIKYRLFGVVLLAVLALFVTVTVAVYRKAFTPAVHVTLHTDHVGNQLAPGADVKVRGLMVGTVSSISSTGDGAALRLDLVPDKVHLLPSNVTAQLLPKTLFGERYVDLGVPADPAPTALADGAVIDEDHSSAAIEVQQVLADLMPVLQAMRPQQLSSTLDAMATALSGRGQQLGATLVQLDDYLKKINPALPDLNADIAGLASVSGTYDEAAPQLLNALSELTTTARTVTEHADDLSRLYAAVTASSVDLTNFLRANKNNVINLVTTSTPTLRVLARYAPEYPCMLKQLAEQIPATDQAYGKGSAHPDAAQITLVITGSRGKYQPGVDTPRYDDDRGPRCYQDIVPPARAAQYPAEGPVQDGSTHPAAPAGSGYTTLQNQLGTTTTAGTPPETPAMAGSPAEQQLIATMIAPDLEVPPEQVPGWASMLVAPLFRGTEVTLR
jgi:virulence factor Mce-like protein